MQSKREEDKIVMDLEGRITSANVSGLLEQIDQILEENPHQEPVFDASKLDYISSAGLRALLSVAKKLNRKVTVREVPSEIYEIFEMTGFTKLLNVRKKMRQVSIDGCPVIGRGAMGTVYRIDEDTVVKVYDQPGSGLAMIEQEQTRSKQAFLKGIPTAISYDVVKVGDLYGSVFEMVKATTFNDLIIKEPARTDEILERYAKLLRQMHSVLMEKGEVPDARENYLRYLEELTGILPEDLQKRLQELFLAMPEDLHMIHGDVQMKNIMLDGEEPLLIDMETLSCGNPVFDLQGIYLTYNAFREDEPGNAQAFLGMSNETADYIGRKSLEDYFEDRGETLRPEYLDRIRIAAYVHFLNLVTVQQVGLEELRQIRVQHAVEHLRELAERVETLEI